MPTIRDALRRGAARLQPAGIDNPRLEARLLLAHALGMDGSQLLRRDQNSVVDAAGYDALLSRRVAREPLALIVGHREFWSLDFAVSPATLIPRPDSETLIEAALAVFAGAARPVKTRPVPVIRTSTGAATDDRDTPGHDEGGENVPHALAVFSGTAPATPFRPPVMAGLVPAIRTSTSAATDGRNKPGHDSERDSDPPPRRVLDLGTGTGCLLLAALSEFPHTFGVGVDRCPAATALAASNAAMLGMADRAAFLCGDWAAAVGGRFDLILCNPPYIATAELEALMPDVSGYEPPLALDGGGDGYDAYRAVIPELGRLLAPDGIAVLELGQGQAETVAWLAREAGFAPAAHCDLSGIMRALVLRRA